MMRTLFIAAGRIFGLLQIYHGLTYVTSMVAIIGMMRRASSDTTGAVVTHTFSGASVALTTGSMIVTLVLTFGVAWLLLFRAEWLADKLKVPEQGAEPPLTGDAILQVGARILGLFVIVQAAPDLIGQLGRTISEIQQLASLRYSMASGVMERAIIGRIWSSLVAPALKLTIGLVLVLKTDSVLNWIERKKQTTKQKTT